MRKPGIQRIDYQPIRWAGAEITELAAREPHLSRQALIDKLVIRGGHAMRGESPPQLRGLNRLKWKPTGAETTDEGCLRGGTVLPSSMRCTVTLLRREGMRLRAHELAKPVAGDLEVTDHLGDSTFRRAIRVANLWAETSSGTRRSLLVPLWDPAVLRIGPDVITLHGIELCAATGRVCEHQQVWRCALIR